MRRVRVGSTSPPKLAGVRAALEALLEEIEVEGVEVESGVPEQPLGFEEITAGARARARGAGAQGPCDLAVGYEDGLVRVRVGGLPAAEETWMNVGCAAVSDGEVVHLGLSSGFAYPPEAVAAAVSERAPIGPVFDRLWQAHRGQAGAEPSGRGLGNVGRLSEGVLTRTEYTRHAVLCALVAFLQPDLYGLPERAS